MFVITLTGADFSTQSREVGFPASDQLTSVNIDLTIGITNDIINEAGEVFVVRLELVNAVDPNRVNLNVRIASLCRIGDNDRKLIY